MQVAFINPIKIHNLKTCIKFSSIILPSSKISIQGSMLSFWVEKDADNEESLLPIDRPKCASYRAYASLDPSPTKPTQ